MNLVSGYKILNFSSKTAYLQIDLDSYSAKKTWIRVRTELIWIRNTAFCACDHVKGLRCNFMLLLRWCHTPLSQRIKYALSRPHPPKKIVGSLLSFKPLKVSYYIQHCFICRPSNFTVPTDAGIEPRTVATGALAVRRSNH